MKSRGILLDLDAHADLMLSLEAKRLELGAVYKQACIDSGRAELAAKAPTTPALKRAALEAILSSEELRLWQRTRKTGVLSTARSDLRRADGLPADQGADRLVEDRQIAQRVRPDPDRAGVAGHRTHSRQLSRRRRRHRARILLRSEHSTNSAHRR